MLCYAWELDCSCMCENSAKKSLIVNAARTPIVHDCLGSIFSLPNSPFIKACRVITFQISAAAWNFWPLTIKVLLRLILIWLSALFKVMRRCIFNILNWVDLSWSIFQTTTLLFNPEKNNWLSMLEVISWCNQGSLYVINHELWSYIWYNYYICPM